jgi:alkylation response protein AidB-like acyl-CoA dehydrogenase
MAFDFEFSAEQEELRASVRRFLSERAPMTYVRERWGDPVGTTDEVWQGLADLGATGLLVPVAHGGNLGDGGGIVTAGVAGVVLEELGRMVHPGPFLSTAVTVPALLGTIGRGTRGHDEVVDLQRGIADGSRRAALLGRVGDPPFSASAGDRLRGTDAWVVDGASVDTFVVIARRDGEAHRVYLADAQVAIVEPVETVDGSSGFATVTFDESPSVEINLSHVHGEVDAAVDSRSIGAVVAGVGTASRALELAVEYAKQRHQFGQPVGAFQAVQHLCADMLIDLELGRAGAYYALWAADQASTSFGAGPAAGRPTEEAVRERRRAATMAQAWASDAFARIGASAIQVFGGIGFSWEHDIHLFYKRLLTLQHDGGGTTSHLEDLAAQLLD